MKIIITCSLSLKILHSKKQWKLLLLVLFLSKFYTLRNNENYYYLFSFSQNFTLSETMEIY